MKGIGSRAMLNTGVIICSVCEKTYAMGGCELNFDNTISSSEWSEDDEREWRSLLGTEPARKPNYVPKGQEEMITIQRNNVPSGDAIQSRGVQFLKPMHVSEKGARATIYKVTSPDNGGKPDNFGNPVVIYFNIGGQKYSKGFKFSSDNLADIVGIVGPDESKWVKKELTVLSVKGDEGDLRLAFRK
jgi:hypothetical protein